MKEMRVAFMIYHERTKNVSLEVFFGKNFDECFNNCCNWSSKHNLKILSFSVVPVS